MADSKITVGTRVLNISDRLKKDSISGYTAVGGYTARSDTKKHFVTVQGNEDSDKSVILRYDPVGSTVVYKKNALIGHCNDCAYYNSRIYIAMGGGSTSSKVIASFPAGYTSSDTKTTHKYISNSQVNTGVSVLNNITGIAYMSGNKFILSQGDICSICELTNSDFVEKNRFILSANTKLRSAQDATLTSVPQSIYYKDKILYKAYSFKKTYQREKILKNDILEFELPTNLSVTKPIAIYKKRHICDKSDDNYIKFEIESLSSMGSQFCMAVNEETWSRVQRDSIYKITLP